MDSFPADAKMPLHEYYSNVFVPSNVAVSAMRRAGLPLNRERAVKQMHDWDIELKDLEYRVSSDAEKRGITLRFSAKHAAPEAALIKYFYSADGLDLTPGHHTDTGKPSTDDEAVLKYAAIGYNHRDDDIPEVYNFLKIRSIAKAQGTHLAGLLKALRADGCVHAKVNWNLPNTTRISQENPPLHQLPERSDPEVAKKVKTCLVPRKNAWLGPPEDWDPRKHGWCAKVDVKGAEAVIRSGCIARCGTSVPYLRTGGDIHSKTASILYEVPEGTYKKGDFEREVPAKNSYFLLIFGGSPMALQQTLWIKGRVDEPIEKCEKLYSNFFRGYPDLKTQYQRDTEIMIRNGYIEDPFGRRWFLPMPANLEPYFNGIHREWKFRVKSFIKADDERKALLRQVEKIRHRYANRPTQSAQGTTTLWVIALCHHGEYVPLQAPEYWCQSDDGLIFPDAANWQFNEGEGPGGKPFQVWVCNTVHDSIWLDGAAGTLETGMMTIHRRANGVPAPFLLSANMPWRVEAEVGPDFGHLTAYNKVAKQFGLEPMPDR